MISKTWRQRWLTPLARLLHGAAFSRCQSRRRPRTLLTLEELETRLTPSSATLQFNTASETINQAAGTFSIPVTLTGAVTPTTTTFASFTSSIAQIAFDPAGNLYVATAGFPAGTVSKVTPAGVVSTLAPAFNGGQGLAFHAGNVYATDGNNVDMVTPAGVVSTFATGFNQPIDLTFDTAGNLYVTNFGAGTVSKVTPAGAVSTFATGFDQPWGLAFDAAGNLYVSNGFDGTVRKVTPAGVDTIFASGIVEPTGLAFDGAGNLYVGAAANGSVDVVTPTGAVSTFASGIYGPEYVAFDPAGNLYVSSESTPAGVVMVSKVVATVTVPYTLGGTAVASTDYSGVTNGTLTFPIGQTTENITGMLNGVSGANKTLTFTLGTPSGNATLGSPAANTLTIDETPAPTPILTSISPTSATVGDLNTTVSLTGSGFVLGSTADFNGTPIATTFISATQLTAVIPMADLTKAGADQITVLTNGLGGGTSAAQPFTVSAAPSTTAAANAAAFYNPGAESVALSATVVSGAGTVNEGTETFTILNGTTVIGTAVTVNVVNGAAHANYALPAGLTAGSYTIRAVYSGTVNYLASTNTTHTLTVGPASTTTVAVLKSDGSLWQDAPGVGLQLLSPAGTILSISAVTDGAGNADVYAVTSDHHLWEHTPTSWLYLSAGSFQQLSAATNSAGNAVIFAVLTDHSLWENSSLFPGDHWGLLSPGGTILSISAVTDSAGHDDVYAITSDSHLWEHTPIGWAFLSGDYFHQISAGLNGASQAIVFGVGTDDSLLEYNPAFAGNHLQLLSPAGTILSVSAGAADQVFAVTADNHLWAHSAAGWAILSTGSFASLSGAKNSAGQGDLFAVLSDTSFWEYDPAFPGLWQDLVPSGVAAGSAARTR
jgi:hypothetical protein